MFITFEMNMENQQLIQRFYSAFQQHDLEGMKACYHQDVTFSDEVFPLLKGEQVMAMWGMLLARASEVHLEISCKDVQSSTEHGGCTWEAWYDFSQTGRRVHNVINAHFLFKDGLIIRHQDKFNFWRWASMAFGVTGKLLGWTPFFKKKVRKVVEERLNKFIERNPVYQ